jgi:hypothetical protein
MVAAFLAGPHAQTPAMARAHWPPGAVIRVRVGQSFARPVDPNLVERAMKTWTGAAAGRFRLERAPDGTPADVRVSFATGDALLGETSPITDRRTGLIVGADIAIAANVTGDSIGQQLVVYLTALHELGHALGLPHSDDMADIMYRFRRPDDPDRYFGAYRKRLRSVDDIGSARASGLSARDIATLIDLYSDKPPSRERRAEVAGGFAVTNRE